MNHGNSKTAIAYSKWSFLLQSFHVNPTVTQKIFLDLVIAYSSAGRFYHTLAHIQQVLQTIERMRSLAQNIAAIEFAAWFHDVIYDPKAKDNEEKSAEYTLNILTTIGIPASTIDKVIQLILATKTHQAPADDIDSQIFLDADLSILGSSEAEYRVYSQAIRQEYSWLSDLEYRLGRKQVLQKFLNKDRIYLTQKMFIALETKARQNIQAEIEFLSEVNVKKILE